MPILPDSVDEAAEGFDLQLSSASGAAIVDGVATGIIQDDDNPILTVTDTEVVEGDAGETDAVFFVNLSYASAVEVTASYSTYGVSAGSDDYARVSGELSIPAGETAVPVPVPVFGDTEAEGNEVFRLRLTRIVNADTGDDTGDCTILDDDSIPSLAIQDGSPVETSGTTTLTFDVTLTE